MARLASERLAGMLCLIDVDAQRRLATTVVMSPGGGRLLGYARVSRDDQDLGLQTDALEKHGIAKSLIFMDELSGARSDRPGQVSRYPGKQRRSRGLAAGSTGPVHASSHRDRRRSPRSKCRFPVAQRGAIDTTSASGELIFNIFSALAQFERCLIQERTKAGLAAARARGRRGGHPRLEAEEAKVRAAKKLAADRPITIDDICETLNISRATYYRYLTLGADAPPGVA